MASTSEKLQIENEAGKYQLRSLFESAGSGAQYARDYFTRMAEIMRSVDVEQMERAIDIVEKTYQDGGTVFLIGNGGSSATCSHFVNDVVAGAWVEGQPPFRAISLTDNVESLTAISNDVGYEEIFAYQLQTMMRPGDTIIALSVSGNSENIIRGVRFARSGGGRVIGWTGFEGGRLKDLCDVCVHAPTTPDEYGPVEDLFSILEHVMTGYLAMKRGRKLHH